EKGNLRHPDALAIEIWLDHHVREQLDGEEEPYGEQGPLPVVEHGEAQHDGSERGHEWAQIGNEAKGEGEKPQCHRVGDTNEEKAEPEGGPVSRIDHRLGYQVAADSLRRVVEPSGHAGEPAMPGETNEPVTYLVLLDEHEDHEHEHEARAPQRFEDLGDRPYAHRVRLHHDGDRRALALGGLILLELTHDFLRCRLHLGQGPVLTRPPNIRDLSLEVDP